MRNRVIQAGLLTVLGILLVGGTAGVASGAVLAQDNFDNVASGSLPIPQVGTWCTAWYNALVGTGIVTAHSGTNYLNSKAGAPPSFQYAVDLVGAALAPGTAVHVEVWINDRNGYGAWGLVENDYVGSTGPWNWIIRVGTDYKIGAVLAESAAGSLLDTGVAYSPQTWQLWQIDYVVGADSYTLTVDGNSVVLNADYMKNSAATQLAIVMVDTWWSSGGQMLADDLLVTADIATPLVKVIGTVVPQDYTGDLTDVQVKIELRQGGIAVQTEKMALGSDGRIELRNVPAGTYDVAIKSYAHLRKVLANVAVSADPTNIGIVNLVNGDGDGDNAITSTDLAVVLTSMDLPGDP